MFWLARNDWNGFDASLSPPSRLPRQHGCMSRLCLPRPRLVRINRAAEMAARNKAGEGDESRWKVPN